MNLNEKGEAGKKLTAWLIGLDECILYDLSRTFFFCSECFDKLKIKAVIPYSWNKSTLSFEKWITEPTCGLIPLKGLCFRYSQYSMISPSGNWGWKGTSNQISCKKISCEFKPRNTQAKSPLTMKAGAKLSFIKVGRWSYAESLSSLLLIINHSTFCGLKQHKSILTRFGGQKIRMGFTGAKIGMSTELCGFWKVWGRICSLVFSVFQSCIPGILWFIGIFEASTVSIFNSLLPLSVSLIFSFLL